MAITFKLKYGDPSSWSYIDLTDADHGMVNYTPQAPEEGAEEIVESGVWRVHGSSLANLILAVQAIDNVFRRAAEYEADRIGADQVFVTGMLDGSTTWESPIYEGRVQLPETAFRADWANWSMDVTITWRRAAYWELYESPLNAHNTNGTDNTNVFNCNDGSGSSPNKKENFLDLHSDQVLGDLPAPAIFILTGGAGPHIKEVLICQNAKAGPTSVVYYADVGTVSDTADANRSGGYYKILSVPAAGTGLDLEAVSATLADLRNGAWLRFMLCAKFNGILKVKPYILLNTIKYYGATSIITSGGTNFELFDLGPVYLPELSSNFDNQFNAVSVGINFYHATGLSVNVDYFQFPPMDSFIHATLDVEIDLGDGGIVVDSKAGRVWSTNSTNDKIMSMGTVQGGIYLEPGKLQQLVFKFDAAAGDVMSTVAIVRVDCFHRKRTL